MTTWLENVWRCMDQAWKRLHIFLFLQHWTLSQIYLYTHTLLNGWSFGSKSLQCNSDLNKFTFFFKWQPKPTYNNKNIQCAVM